MPRKKSMRTAPSPEAAHHPYGPSRWPALVECSQWESRPSSEDAERGTALHELFARVLNGEEVAEPDAQFEANVVKLATKFRSMYLEDRDCLPVGERVMLVEALVHLTTPTGSGSDIYGRVDCAFMDRARRLHVVDLKSAEHVDRDHIPQLIGYANGIVSSAGFRPVAVCFHLAYADSGRDLEVQMPVDEVWNRYAELYERIQSIAAGEKMPPRQCGWCSLCSKHESCPAARAVAETVSATLADAPERWPQFSPERKAQLCVLAEAVSKWSDAIKRRAGEDARSGILIQDAANGIFYGLQERKGHLAIDVDKAWQVAKANGIARERFLACLKVDGARFKDELRAELPNKDAEAALETCGTRGPSSMAFVRLRKGA